MTIRSLLDSVPPNQTFDLLRETPFGALLNALIKVLTFTETAVVPSANVATLAAQPSSLGVLRALATAETGAAHEKEVLIGPITGSQAIIPPPGVCVWDGGTKVLFNTVDAVTAASFLYLKDSDTTAGVLQRQPGVRSSP
jgi:hypothetical protein